MKEDIGKKRKVLGHSEKGPPKKQKLLSGSRPRREAGKGYATNPCIALDILPAHLAATLQQPASYGTDTKRILQRSRLS